MGFAAICVLAALVGTTAAQTRPDTTAPQSAEDGGPRRWQVVGGALPLHAAPSDDAEVIGTFDEGAILSNLGCLVAADRTWCDVRPFRGGARGFVPAQSLRPAHGPDGAVATGVDDSAARARRRDFDAKGEIACAQERGHVLGRCAAAVARGSGGDATVVATFPNGFARTLTFVHGQFVSANATMSGVGRDVDWQLESDVHRLAVDDQVYKMSDAFVFGE